VAKKKAKKKKKGKRKAVALAETMASRADRYELYLQSVQAPDVDVKFFQRVYKSNFKRPAQVLREDFCGTAAVCCEWVGKRGEREAYGVDLDPEPLEWGQRYNLPLVPDGRRDAVHFVEGDVRSAKTPEADVITAQNFSYCCFKTRDELREYFKVAHGNLGEQGVFILDLFGGYESIEDDREDERDLDGFTYVWEQHKYDPINAFGTYRIHFRFEDGSEMENAFVYDWRVWTIPEVREVLEEAGFDAVDVYWEDEDQNGEGTGQYSKQKRGTCDPAWNAYIVGVKSG